MNIAATKDIRKEIKKSIDFAKLELQHGDNPPLPFSYQTRYLRRRPNDIFTLNEWQDGMFLVMDGDDDRQHSTDPVYRKARMVRQLGVTCGL